MAAPANPIKYHPAAGFNPVGISTIPITLGADVDFTLPAGQTGGYCPRNLLIGSAGGTVEYYDITGAGPYTQTLSAGYFDQAVSYIVNAGTSATISAVL